MSALSVGQRVTIPELPGDWSVWSHAGGDWPPGSYFVVPSSGGGYAVIHAVQRRADPHPTLSVLQFPQEKS